MHSAHPRPAAWLSRRHFLGAGAASAAALSVAATGRVDAAAVPGGRATRVIFLLLTGGPSQLDTFDPKPDAPAEVRGPFSSIATAVPGLRFSEHLPRTAAVAQRIAVVRSVHHAAAPVHETGLQLLQCGRLSRGAFEQPHFGAVLSHRLGRLAAGQLAFARLGGPLGYLGISVSSGQAPGPLGAPHGPMDGLPDMPAAEPPAVRDRYGMTPFGANCLRACRLAEAGVRCVVVNMFNAVHDTLSWDCHADRRFLGTTLDDYRRTLCPAFDRAYAALIGDLHERGLLRETLVVAAGEMGRTPRLNAHGGRDHWPGVWSVLLAGGGVAGGRVVGASDKHGAAPARRPVAAQDVAATVFWALGIDPQTPLAGPGGEAVPLTDGHPVAELFD